MEELAGMVSGVVSFLGLQMAFLVSLPLIQTFVLLDWDLF